jgi:hypothetical protein
MEAIEKDRANYELLRQAVQKGVPAPPFFGSALTFRVSIYEKCANLYKSALDLSDIVRCNRLRAASLMVWRCVADLKPGVFDAPLRGCGA